MARFPFWFAWLLALVNTTGAAEFRLPKHSTAPPAWLLKLEHSPLEPRSGQPVRIRARVRASVANAVLLYQVVAPGSYIELQDAAFTNNWVSLPMRQTAASQQDELTFEAELPGTVQQNRRLIRYRLAIQDTSGKRLVTPDFGDVPANYAYFVYDGIPAWTGSIDPRSDDPKLAAPMTFPPETMRRVQTYYLLGKRRSIENVTWREQSPGKEYQVHGNPRGGRGSV